MITYVDPEHQSCPDWFSGLPAFDEDDPYWVAVYYERLEGVLREYALPSFFLKNQVLPSICAAGGGTFSHVHTPTFTAGPELK